MRILLCAVVLAVQTAGAADLPVLVGDGERRQVGVRYAEAMRGLRGD